MAECVSALVDNLFRTYCFEWNYLPIGIPSFYLISIFLTSILLYWKGIKITTLPFLFIFLLANLIIFADRIIANNTNYTFYEIRRFDVLRTINVDDHTITTSVNMQNSLNIQIPIFILLLNFFGVLIAGSRHYLKIIYKTINHKVVK